MPTHTLAGVDAAAVSRLRIHAAAGDGWSVEALLQRLRGRMHDRRAVLALEIDELHGHRVLALDDAGPLVDVALAPGTYHVNTAFAGRRRRYTVTLAPGAAFDLHLRRGGPCG